MNQDKNTNYMTAGQLAREAGVSLRTLRFYDQKGILIPAERGTGNVRFYTKAERERLYQILCYKFMGMSLDEIAVKLADNATPEEIGRDLHEKVMEAEESISKQMRQFAIMKDLEALSSAEQKPENWMEYAKIIDYIKVKWDMIWQLNKAFVNGMETSGGPEGGSDEMKQYYQLMTEVLQKMNQGIDPESDEMMEIMKRYFDLNPNETLIRVDPNIMEVKGDNASDLWMSIKDYMKKASNHYKDNKKTEEEE